MFDASFLYVSRWCFGLVSVSWRYLPSDSSIVSPRSAFFLIATLPLSSVPSTHAAAACTLVGTQLGSFSIFQRRSTSLLRNSTSRWLTSTSAARRHQPRPIPHPPNKPSPRPSPPTPAQPPPSPCPSPRPSPPLPSLAKRPKKLHPDQPSRPSVCGGRIRWLVVVCSVGRSWMIRRGLFLPCRLLIRMLRLWRLRCGGRMGTRLR